MMGDGRHSRQAETRRFSHSASSPRTTLDLQRLVPMWPPELASTRKEDRLRLLSRLRKALKDERRRGLAGHWAYDLARHAQLVEAYRAEVRRFLADFGRQPALPGAGAPKPPG